MGRYTFGILGLLLLVAVGGGGFLSYSAHKHHTTLGWEYQRLTQNRLPELLSGGESTRRTKKRLKANISTLTEGKTATLDTVLANPDKVVRDNAPRPTRPTRNDWLTGDHDQ